MESKELAVIKITSDEGEEIITDNLTVERTGGHGVILRLTEYAEFGDGKREFEIRLESEHVEMICPQI